MFVLIILPVSYAMPRSYLNDSATYTIILASANKTLDLTSNLTLDENINHSFEANTNSGLGKFDVEYVASNTTGFLLRLRIDKDADLAASTVRKVDCINTGTLTTLCDNGCGGNDFGVYNNFTLQFNSTSLTAKLFINNVAQSDIAVCTNATQIGSVKFSRQSGTANIKNNLLTANNKPPQFIGSLPNITWPENTSIGFNISGNFSDANNDTLTFSLEAAVENITINVNQSTGIVNLTPDPDFFGIRYARFIANDSDNITFSNNVTLTVTNVNDLPTISSTTISNTDDLSRTNGTLTASWTFDDKDQDIISINETLWFINGIENASLRNSITINPPNTTKNQNWSFSVRINDGTGFSNFAYSANLTIQNALQAFSHALGVENIERNRLFTYDVNYTDLDNDNITFSDNSSLFDITNEGIINFTPALAGNITVNITLSQNPNVSGILTIEVEDSAAPEITAIGASSSGTSTVTVTLSVTTDETAICNFATTDLNFSSMAMMSSTNSLSHSNSQSFTSDTSGTYYVRCNDTIGNAMNFSNSTAFNADIQEPSSGGGDSGGGGGGGGWQCRYVVQCTGWSECAGGEQTRDCGNVEVVPFYSPTKCEYLLKQETERECAVEVEEEEKVEEEPEIDEEKTFEEEEQTEATGPTGAVILSDLMGNLKPMHGLIALGIIAAIGIGSYAYFRRPSSELTEEEMERLHKMMEREYLKAKEQDRIN